MISDSVLAIYLPLVFIGGILLADLVFKIWLGKTISQAVWRVSVAKPWYAVIAAGLIGLLILHLWTGLFF